MKTLGLLGGMTWHSTADYYRLINDGVQRKLGGVHSAEIVMYSLDFAPVEALQDAGRWDELGRIMAAGARRLASAGAHALVICANTMHRLAPEAAEAGLPIIHIADAAAAAVKARGLRTVGLLGTRYTMEQDFYRGKLEREHGLRVLIPDATGLTTVHGIIYRELAVGVIREESRRAYVEVIEGLENRGAEGIILGCTEIPLLIRQQDVTVPVFDTTALHAAAAVDFALAG